MPAIERQEPERVTNQGPSIKNLRPKACDPKTCDPTLHDPNTRDRKEACAQKAKAGEARSLGACDREARVRQKDRGGARADTSWPRISYVREMTCTKRGLWSPTQKLTTKSLQPRDPRPSLSRSKHTRPKGGLCPEGESQGIGSLSACD